MEDYTILIGGSPTVGKTFTTSRLSAKLKIPWISTDFVRGLMKDVADTSKYPSLIANEPYTAEKYLAKYSPEEIVERQNRESIDVWKGVESLIKRRYPWYSFIIEGVGILPSLVHETYSNNRNVLSIFLINNNEESIRKTVFERGLWDDAKTYSDSVKEREVEWVLLHNNWLLQEAEKYSYPWIRVEKDGDDYLRVIEALKLDNLKLK